MSSFNLLWKWLLIFLNFNALIVSNKSPSKWINSLTWGAQLKDLIEWSKKVVDYLNVTLNLKDGTYKPYHKPDNKITYINVQSNHPQNTIKQLPKTIEQRLSNNSSNETIFIKVAPPYEKALKKKQYKKQNQSSKVPKKRFYIKIDNAQMNKSVTA